MELDTLKPQQPLSLDPDEQAAPGLEDQEGKGQGRESTAWICEDKNALWKQRGEVQSPTWNMLVSSKQLWGRLILFPSHRESLGVSDQSQTC